jgi:hypothetical protein
VLILSEVLTSCPCGIGFDHTQMPRNHELDVVGARNLNQVCHAVSYRESGNAGNGCTVSQ